MKAKSIITFVLLMTTTFAFSQVGVNKQYHEKDTTRTFALVNVDVDHYIERYTEAWGEPDENTSGIIVWEDVSIAQIGEHLNITIQDGISTLSEGTLTFKTFSSAEDKKQKLENKQPKQYRMTDIIILNQNKVNFVNTPDLESGILMYLNSLVE